MREPVTTSSSTSCVAAVLAGSAAWPKATPEVNTARKDAACAAAVVLVRIDAPCLDDVLRRSRDSIALGWPTCASRTDAQQQPRGERFRLSVRTSTFVSSMLRSRADALTCT